MEDDEVECCPAALQRPVKRAQPTRQVAMASLLAGRAVLAAGGWFGASSVPTRSQAGAVGSGG
jgi:hypothetical protein